MIRVLFTLLVIHVAASPTLAQASVPLPDAEGSMMTNVFALIIVIVTGLTTIINPKRTHLT